MSIVTEIRWQCDYCGNVSPPLKPGLRRIENKPPHGWDTIPPEGNHYIRSEYHFCTPAHKDAWEAQHKQEHLLE